MPNWPQALFQTWLPELSKWRQGTEETSYSWLTLLAWTQDGSLLRNGIWTPPSPGGECCRGGGSNYSSGFVEQKSLHKMWGIQDTFQATRVTKEIISSIMTSCIFFNYLESTVSLQYNTFCLPSTSQFELAVVFSLKPPKKVREKTFLLLYFLFFLKNSY